MGRPNRSAERRQEAVRAIAATFAKLGYRRATTAELAARCHLTEVALYRLWPDKRAMFVAAIRFVGENTERIWRHVAANGDGPTAATRILAHERAHLGEFGFHRILFAGWSETDDTEIKAALRDVYRRLSTFIGAAVEAHRGGSGLDAPPAAWTAWALIGLGTAALGRSTYVRCANRCARRCLAAS